jgi:nicotinamide-nucleotide amidase
MLAEVIAIGDELTSGQRLDTNSQWLSRELGLLGIPVGYHTTVCDTLEAGREAFATAAQRTQLVLATGGLGPTADDLTRDVLAAVAGVPLVCCERSLAEVNARFARRGMPMPESNRRQALFPEGSQPIPNPTGTAPGIDLTLPAGERWGQGRGARIFTLPGVPAEMRRMWQETVAPVLVDLAGGSRVLQHRRLKCFGAGESALEEMLPGLIERGRDPTVGITAHEATITLRISAWAASASECAAKISDTEQVIRDALGPLVYGEEDDEVEDAATQSLRTARLSLATVEAGTGGRVAALMAQAAARQSAAAVFRGGIVLPELSSESDTLVRAALHVAEQQGADLGLAVGPVRLSDERQAVDIVIASGEWREVHEHHLGGGDIALSRAAKVAIDRVRFVAADCRVGKLGGTS